MISPNHILSQEGILSSFSIAKKISEEELKKLKEEVKKKGIAEDEVQKVISKDIVNQTQKDIENNVIPGLVWKGKLEKRARKSKLNKKENVESIEDAQNKIIDLTHLATIIAKQVANQKLDKYYTCYLINAIISVLRLTDKDFDDFYNRFSDFQQGDEGLDEE